MPPGEQFLKEVLNRIEPTPAQKEGAQRSHNHLRELLNRGQFENRIQATYLSGSYSRDTAIAPLDDVDLIVIIDPAPWRDFIDRCFELRPEPARVLDSFERAVRTRYENSSVHRQRRSICLELDHIFIDIVPAIASESNPDFIFIPDRREDIWVRSSPKTHADLATSINSKRDGLFKPLVKLAKYWNSNLPETARFRSFAIETMCVRFFSEITFGSLAEGLTKFLDGIAYVSENATLYKWGFYLFTNRFDINLSLFACSVPDAAGTGTNTAAGLREKKSSFLRHALRSRNLMHEASECSSEDKAASLLRSALGM